MRKLIAILLVASPLFAESSLSFSVTSNRVNHGTGSSMANLLGTSAPSGGATYAFWLYPTAITADRIILQKGLFGTGTATVMGYQFGSGNFYCQGQFSTTSAYAEALVSSLSSFGSNKWVFVACVLDGVNGSSAQRIYTGDVANAAAEPTYVSQTAPSGTHTDDSAEALCGGNHCANNEGAPENIGWIGVWNRALSQAEIQEVQRSGRIPSGLVLSSYYGRNGTGRQVDESGNGNHGTVSGATASTNGPPIFISDREK